MSQTEPVGGAVDVESRTRCSSRRRELLAADRSFQSDLRRVRVIRGTVCIHGLEQFEQALRGFSRARRVGVVDASEARWHSTTRGEGIIQTPSEGRMGPVERLDERR